MVPAQIALDGLSHVAHTRTRYGRYYDKCHPSETIGFNSQLDYLQQRASCVIGADRVCEAGQILTLIISNAILPSLPSYSYYGCSWLGSGIIDDEEGNRDSKCA